MNTIVRAPERHSGWDVFNDLDSVFEGFLRPTRRNFEGGALVPAMDVSETDHEYLVKAELPGIKKEDLEVAIQDGVLTINAETRYDNEHQEDGRIIRQERRYGKFVRSMRLGNEVDKEKVKAEYKDGILALSLPKAEAVKPKKIEVNVV
jgi:HSP20 family protein